MITNCASFPEGTLCMAFYIKREKCPSSQLPKRQTRPISRLLRHLVVKESPFTLWVVFKK